MQASMAGRDAGLHASQQLPVLLCTLRVLLRTLRVLLRKLPPLGRQDICNVTDR